MPLATTEAPPSPLHPIKHPVLEEHAADSSEPTRPALQVALRSPDLPAERLLVPGLPRDRRLAARAWHVLAQTTWSGLSARYLGAMALFGGHRVYAGAGTDWVLLNLAEDPLLRDRHGFPVPGRVLEDLRRIARKVEFDALFVAHEVPSGAVVEDVPPTPDVLSPPPARRVETLSGRLGRAGQALWGLAALPLLASGLVATLVAGGTAVLGGVALDPVLLGVVVGPGKSVRPGEPAAWFYLGHWVYGGE